MIRRLASMSVAFVVALVVATGASAGVVTVGSPLLGDFSQTSYGGNPNTWLNDQIATPGAVTSSPVDGVVIRWRMTGAFEGGPFRLRILRPGGGGAFGALATSAPWTPANAPATQTIATNLPIKAGDTIAIDPEHFADKIGTMSTSNAAAKISFWGPQLVDGAAATLPTGSFSAVAELGFNADVLPLPTISGIAPANGSIAGGTSVVVTGTNFAEVQSVRFGAVPAASFAVNSDTQLTAIAPKTAVLSKAQLGVTTLAGSATSAASFEYKACKVPKLKKKSLKSAKKALKKAGCKLGKVKKTGGATSSSGRVKSQKKKAGKLLAPGTKIGLTLGPK